MVDNVAGALAKLGSQDRILSAVQSDSHDMDSPLRRSPAEGAYSEGFIAAKFTQDFCIECPATSSLFSLKSGEIMSWWAMVFSAEQMHTWWFLAADASLEVWQVPQQPGAAAADAEGHVSKSCNLPSQAHPGAHARQGLPSAITTYLCFRHTDANPRQHFWGLQQCAVSRCSTTEAPGASRRMQILRRI